MIETAKVLTTTLRSLFGHVSVDPKMFAVRGVSDPGVPKSYFSGDRLKLHWRGLRSFRNQSRNDASQLRRYKGARTDGTWQ